jgi:hypothetical protein
VRLGASWHRELEREREELRGVRRKIWKGNTEGSGRAGRRMMLARRTISEYKWRSMETGQYLILWRNRLGR